MIWAWELAGNFYKSRLTKHLVRVHGAMVTSGTIEEKNIGNQVQNYIELHGCGPAVIIVDRPRDDGPVNWKVFEDVKGGKLVNVKWKVNDVDWESPQLVIFANEDPAEFVGTKMSSDEIVDVETRAFNAGLEAADGAGPQDLAEPRAHPVVKSYD